MAGDNRARKRSAASSTDSNPVNKKAKTGILKSQNDDKKSKKHGKVATKQGFEKSKSIINVSKDVIKPIRKLSPQGGKKFSGKVIKNEPNSFVYFT